MRLREVVLRHAASLAAASAVLSIAYLVAFVPKQRALGMSSEADLVPGMLVVVVPVAALWASLRTLASDAPRRDALEVVLLASGLAALVALGAYLAVPAANVRLAAAMQASSGLSPPRMTSPRVMSLSALRTEADALGRASPPRTHVDRMRLASLRLELGRRFALPALSPIFALVALLLVRGGPGFGRILSAIVVVAAGFAWSWLDDMAARLAFRWPDAGTPLGLAPDMVLLLAAWILGALGDRLRLGRASHGTTA